MGKWHRSDEIFRGVIALTVCAQLSGRLVVCRSSEVDRSSLAQCGAKVLPFGLDLLETYIFTMYGQASCGIASQKRPWKSAALNSGDVWWYLEVTVANGPSELTLSNVVSVEVEAAPCLQSLDPWEFFRYQEFSRTSVKIWNWQKACRFLEAFMCSTTEEMAFQPEGGNSQRKRTMTLPYMTCSHIFRQCLVRDSTAMTSCYAFLISFAVSWPVNLCQFESTWYTRDREIVVDFSQSVDDSDPAPRHEFAWASWAVLNILDFSGEVQSCRHTYILHI